MMEIETIFKSGWFWFVLTSILIFLMVVSMNGSICTPNWITGTWSSCVSGIQTRTVTDANTCGVNTGKPSTSQSCSSTCTPSWTCSAWSACVSSLQTRTCTDANTCGTTANRPSLSQTCSDIKCLKNGILYSIGDRICMGDTVMECKMHDASNALFYGVVYCKDTCLDGNCINADGCISIPHSTKRCIGNSLYWYDSCGNQEEEFINCGGGVCRQGVCYAS